jgi:hypothetical protein
VTNTVYAVLAFHDRRPSDRHDRGAASLGGGLGELAADSSYSSIPEIAHKSAKRVRAAETMTTELHACCYGGVSFQQNEICYMTPIIYLSEIAAERSVDHCRLDFCDEGINRDEVSP